MPARAFGIFRIQAGLALLLVAALALSGGCARRAPVTEITPIKAANRADLERQLLSRNPEVAQFRMRGPFAVSERADIEVAVPSGPRVLVDVFLCAEKAPLVILVHGHGNSKDDHAFQAMHLASWGMHSVTVQLPNQGPWIANGRTLARVVRAIRSSPQILDKRIDPEKIVLAGHSFGATAVAAALAEGVPVIGAVLLDPAGIGRELPSLLRRVKVPVVVVGADEDIWTTRNREYFYRFIPRGIGEISIRDALHDDAAHTPARGLFASSDDPLATEEAQISFVSALTAAAFALSVTGNMDYAWTSFDDALKKGVFFNARRK
jgi:pimeloyl-ACP methyl ester carboxylesterase